ncbi:hypothetical protein TNCV_4230031 [Trichonephila clavipes]|uniref:Uncharacterized protein n=1 Tax=Trichonephila clavipes TaxID=2585209 RepID=A0A8X6SDF8_TRICX|nr:hypothetical protein TNCV_4230031 [Trichonephila clavipes]
MSLSIVHSQVFKMSSAPWSTASKLESQWSCFAAYELLLNDGKSSLSTANVSPLFKLHKLWKLFPIFKLSATRQARQSKAVDGRSSSVKATGSEASKKRNAAAKGLHPLDSPSSMIIIRNHFHKRTIGGRTAIPEPMVTAVDAKRRLQ